MSDQIEDFENENLLASFKFRLANKSIESYSNLDLLMNSQRKCIKERCLGDANDELLTIEKMRKCEQNCETGIREVLKMQEGHTEVSRLTYAKNIQRCLQIHANGMNEGQLRQIGMGSD